MSINVGELKSMDVDGRFGLQKMYRKQNCLLNFTQRYSLWKVMMIEMQSEAVCEEIVVSLDMVQWS